MRMTVTPRERDMLIGLAGILIAVLAWFLVVSPTIDKTDILSSENIVLKEKADEYSAVHARVDEYSQGIVLNDVESEEIAAHYPSQVETEDMLMFWSTLSSSYPDDLFLGDINIEERDPVALAGIDDLSGVDYTNNDDGTVTMDDSYANELTSEYALYGAPMSMVCSCTYGGMKDMFNYIIGQYYKNAINAVSISYDETNGVLVGEVGMELYYIEGLDNEYIPTFIPSLPTGQIDVFHTGGNFLASDGSVVDIDGETEELENAG